MTKASNPDKQSKKEKKTKTPMRYVRVYENVKYFGTTKSKVRQNLLSSQPDGEFVFVWTDKLRKLFMLQLTTRLLIELTFLFFYFLIQVEQHNAQLGADEILDLWSVPHTYQCTHGEKTGSPCMTDKTVSCYIPRYVEKTLVLWYMVALTVLSILLTLVELIYFTSKYVTGVHLPPQLRPSWARRRRHSHKKHSVLPKRSKSELTLHGVSEIHEIDMTTETPL